MRRAASCGAPAEASPRALRSEAAALRRAASTSEKTLLLEPVAAKLVSGVALVRSESSRRLSQQLEMIASGEHPLHIEFNLMVALSSLLYGIVAATYFRFDCPRCGWLFTIITLCSLLADSVAPQSRFVTSADRVFASLGVVASPMRVLLVPGLACWQVRGCVLAALITALSVLFWSRASPDMAAFAKRHTLWHVVSVIALTAVAAADGQGLLHLSPFASGGGLRGMTSMAAAAMTEALSQQR